MQETEIKAAALGAGNCGGRRRAKAAKGFVLIDRDAINLLRRKEEERLLGWQRETKRLGALSAARTRRETDATLPTHADAEGCTGAAVVVIIIMSWQRAPVPDWH